MSKMKETVVPALLPKSSHKRRCLDVSRGGSSHISDRSVLEMSEGVVVVTKGARCDGQQTNAGYADNIQ